MNSITLKAHVPVGQSGEWNIERFTVSAEDAKFDELRAAVQGMQGRPYIPVKPGEYTKLKRGCKLVMSDTPAEVVSLRTLYNIAEGDVLINGLGLGIAPHALSKKPEITSITVIEISPDVIRLVAPYLGDKVKVILGDAFSWKPPKGVVYGAVWHDIWDNITSDNLLEMTKLRRKYARRCKWQGCWAYSDCLRVKRCWG